VELGGASPDRNYFCAPPSPQFHLYEIGGGLPRRRRGKLHVTKILIIIIIFVYQLLFYVIGSSGGGGRARSHLGRWDPSFYSCAAGHRVSFFPPSPT